MGFAEKESNRKRGVVSKIAGIEEKAPAEPNIDNLTTDNQMEIEEWDNGKYMPPTEQAVVKPPKKEESRSKRVNLLLTPTLHKAVQKKCKEMGISLNECINQLLQSWVND